MLSAQIAEEQLGLSQDSWSVLSKEIREPRVEISPQGPGYALGWLVVQRPWATGGIALTHSGSNTMNYCTVWCVPTSEEVADRSAQREGTRGDGTLDAIAVLVACNAGGDAAQAAVDAACVDILKGEIAAVGKI
jgi:hypothetical protein